MVLFGIGLIVYAYARNRTPDQPPAPAGTRKKKKAAR